MTGANATAHQPGSAGRSRPTASRRQLGLWTRTGAVAAGQRLGAAGSASPTPSRRQLDAPAWWSIATRRRQLGWRARMGVVAAAQRLDAAGWFHPFSSRQRRRTAPNRRGTAALWRERRRAVRPRSPPAASRQRAAGSRLSAARRRQVRAAARRCAASRWRPIAWGQGTGGVAAAGWFCVATSRRHLYTFGGQPP